MTDIRKGNLSNGLSNIAEYLDLSPEEAVFIHSTVISDEDEMVGKERRQSTGYPLRHSQILAYIPRDKAIKNSKGIILPVSEDLLNYYDKYGMAPRENIEIVGGFEEGVDNRIYPNASVAAQIYKAVKSGNKHLIDILDRKKLVSSYLSYDEVKISQTIDTGLLMRPETQASFNSKILLKDLSQGKYNSPLGITVRNADDFDSKFVEFRKLLEDNSIDIDTVRLYYKPESACSGKGICQFFNLNDETIEKIRELSYQFDVFDPFILEIDVNSMPNEELVANVGVQSVISKSFVTLLGSTSQKVHNNAFIGCEVTPEFKKYKELAEETAALAFAEFRKSGYIGYMSLDVLITYNEKTCKYKGYNIDNNARFSGSTPIVSMMDYSSKMLGKEVYGITYGNLIKNDENLVNKVLNLCGESLYKGKESKFSGIFPAEIDDRYSRDEKRYVRTIVIGEDIDYVRNIYSDFKKRIIADLG